MYLFVGYNFVNCFCSQIQRMDWETIAIKLLQIPGKCLDVAFYFVIC